MVDVQMKDESGVMSPEEEREQRKSSTLNSMYITTTIQKPCVDSIIQAVATILHSQMLEVSSDHSCACLLITICIGFGIWQTNIGTE